MTSRGSRGGATTNGFLGREKGGHYEGRVWNCSSGTYQGFAMVSLVVGAGTFGGTTHGKGHSVYGKTGSRARWDGQGPVFVIEL